MEILLTFIVGALIVYVVWLQLQLYINRRVIQELQHTTITTDGPTRFNLKAALAGLGLLLVTAGLVTAWLR